MTTAVIQPRILIVEDEIIVARDIQAQLAEMGCLCVGHATQGAQAIVLAEQLRPDLVLMDIQLPGAMDGVAAAQAIRTQFSLPVVFLTAFDADATLARAELTEPFGYILKPFSERELRTVLRMALYKHQAETKLRESALHTQAILDHLVDGVITINGQGLIESCNPAASRMFGYANAEALGRPMTVLIPQSHRRQHVERLKYFRNGGAARLLGQNSEVTGQRKDGGLFPVNLSISQILRDEQTTFVVIARDLSQQRDDEDKVHRLAFYDRLTELPNRRLLMDHVHQAMLTSARSAQHAALLLLDLDHFKQLNETLGLEVGDLLLQQVAQRLKSSVREGDRVARLGGDEFVVLLEGLSHQVDEAATQAEITANKIVKALRQPYALREHPCNSTPSLGIVLFQGIAQCLDELLKRADIAMYQAKSAGRNTVRFFDATMQAAVLAHAARVEDLTRGLARQEFVLHYQIQVNRHGAPVGAEALVRWDHPSRGLVSPAEFIPLAEETQLILPLGQWVLQSACAQLQVWAARADTARWTMAVNVSALQFSQADFVTCVTESLQGAGADPCHLKLELTESMLLNNVEDVIIKMKQLKALGVRFSLDDFGTGFSSLSFLKRLPLDQLKIDQSFVRDLMTDPNDAVIAHAIVALGHSLGLKVIAEGVETAAQRDMLAGIHCDAFQGFYFGRPVLAADLANAHGNCPVTV